MTIVTTRHPYSSAFTFLQLCNSHGLVHEGLVNPGSRAIMGVTISAYICAPPIGGYSNVDSEPNMYSMRKLYCLVPYGANNGEWLKQ